MPTLLLADDDASIRTVLARAFEKSGYDVLATGDGQDLMGWVQEGKGDVVITDVIMPADEPYSNGIDMLRRMKKIRPNLPVIVISAHSTLMTAVKANEAGAYEYLAKPFDLDELIHCAAAATHGAANENSKDNKASRSESLEESLAHHAIIGTSPAMQNLYRTLARIIPLDLTVMIRGESGTGKELVACALHELGPRAAKPFIAVNMAAIPRELVESELFGHEKGAFTGANSRKAGTFEQAQGGTVFLDEIGDMPPEAQTKLLRVLQQGEFSPVGSATTLKTDARIICATHRNLQREVENGSFREDLFYRLNVVPIDLPPLRLRREDIPNLAMHFLQKAEARGMPAKNLSRNAILALQSHEWPGNVRELENMIYRLCALTSEQVIDRQAIEQQLNDTVGKEEAQSSVATLESLIRQHLSHFFDAHAKDNPPERIHDHVLPLMERPLIEETLRFTDGNQLKAAQILGINRNTLRKRIRELGIETTSVARLEDA